ncbi:phosphatidylserine/phosphatidylglycerophosphate/cardiolipin synthase family protein [Maribacter chungangensis]|uniref:Phosphatidylserine/phosphatidylglycerophosphate/ cardiolipin synthase family protein n=1 Tax=Maribacter chungangensis TaxID=1069117 RepID=A0ABW3B410_9FLAO
MNRFLLFYLLSLSILLLSCKDRKGILPEHTSFCDSIKRKTTTSLSKELATLNDSMKTQTGVYVLEDGGGAMITRAWLTESAEKSIDIQYFIFSLDNVGLIAIDYLVRAADRGVKIRLLVDDLMVDADIEDILILDSHKNIAIRVYNPGVNLGKNIVQKLGTFATKFRSANLRMHNKTFIVDGKVLITGGRNIADEYFDYDHEYNFRDRDVLLLGKGTKKVHTSFEEFWNSELSVPIAQMVNDPQPEKQDKNRFDRLHEYACNPENFWPQIREKIARLQEAFPSIKASNKLVWVDELEFVSDQPGKNDGNSGLGGGGKTTTRLIRLIKNAKKSIEIQSPYLVTTELSQQLFKDAVDRGVKVRILTNSLASTDNLEAFAGYQSTREALLKTGVRIFEFRPDAAARMQIMTGELQKTINYTPIFGLHSKSMVVDSEITVIGTFNLDPRSANLNTECVTIIHSDQVAQNVLVGIEKEFNPENAWETTLEFNPDSKVDAYKRIKTWTRKILPKDIL